MRPRLAANDNGRWEVAQDVTSLSRRGIEVFVPIPGYEGHYEVSNLGVVKSLDRTCPHRWGKVIRSGRVLRSMGGTYYRVKLFNKTGQKCYFVHQLVLLAFVGPYPLGLEIRHLDDNKKNNNLYNLCYGTRLQNRADRTRNELDNYARGKHQGLAKLTETAVLFIRASGLPRGTLAEKYGVSGSTIYDARIGKTWKHALPK